MQMRNAYKIVVGNHERTRPLGTHRRKQEDNNGIVVTVTGREDVQWSHLTQYRNSWRIL
jgi:hypothetical protein